MRRLERVHPAVRARVGSIGARRSGCRAPAAPCPRPTAAAEPLEDPPGVCAGSCGLRVLPGVRVANSVVTVLPMIDRAGGAQALDHRGVAGRRPPGVQHGAVLRRHVGGVDDVLEPDGHAVQRAERPAPHRRPTRRPRAPAPARGRDRGRSTPAPSGSTRADAREAGPRRARCELERAARGSARPPRSADSRRELRRVHRTPPCPAERRRARASPRAASSSRRTDQRERPRSGGT